MAEEVGTAFVSILPSMRGFSTRLKADLRRELMGIDPVVHAAGARAGHTFGSAMGASLKSAAGRFGQILKTGLVAGAAAAAAGLGAITFFGLKSAASLEQTQIGFESLTGSAQEATKFIKELQQFSAKTPFEFQGVADAARRILAFGQSVGITQAQVIPTLTTIGDLVSVLGGTQENTDGVIRAFGQIASKGRLMGGEILQIAEQLPGFNVNQAIAAKLGVSVAEALQLQEAGAIDAKTAIDGILEGMANFKGAAGAMEKQSQTLTGVFSTFKDTMSIALTEAFTPVIPAIKSALTAVTPVLEGVLQQLGPQLGQLLAAVLPLVGVLAQAFSPAIGVVLEALAGVIPILTPAIDAIAEAFKQVALALAPLLPVLAKVIAELVTGGLVPIILALTPQLADLVVPIGDLLIALIPLIGPLTQLAVLFLQMQAPLIKLTALLISFLAIEGIAPAVDLTARALQNLVDMAKPIVDFVSDLSNWPQIFENVKANLAPIIGGIGQFFAELPGKIGAFLSGLPAMLGNLARQALNNMAFAVGFGIGRIIRFFIELPETVVAAVVGLWALVKGLFTKGADDAKNNAVSGLNQFVDFVKGVPGRVIGFLSSLPGQLASLGSQLASQMYNVGVSIVQGAINGIRDMIGGLINTLTSGFRSAVEGVKRGLGIASPSKVFAEVGKDTVAGYVQGVEGMAAQASLALTSTINPSAARSPAAAPAQRVVVEFAGGDEGILAALKEAIRVRNGGNVQAQLGSV